jgi:hypothetical protein
MKTTMLWKRFVTGGLLLVLLTGCALVAPETPTPEPTALPVPPVPAEIIVVFDGNECAMSRPAELPTGEHVVAYNDLSGKNLILYIRYLADGHTFQDLLDLQSEPGVSSLRPSWLMDIGAATEWKRLAGGWEVYTFPFDQEAEHTILVFGDPGGLWWCGSFQVIGAPSE